jgi:glycerol uptake facilitator-like aquaporin
MKMFSISKDHTTKWESRVFCEFVFTFQVLLLIWILELECQSERSDSSAFFKTFILLFVLVRD